MEDKNTVNYFLFNDRKSTLRCSFILICSLTFFEFYSCFTYILPLLYPKHGTILFCLPPFSFSFHTYFIATPPPTRLHLQSFQPSFPPLFPFQITSISLSFISFSIPIKILFLHHLNPFATKAWQLYRAIAMTLLHKSSAIVT